MELPSKPAYWIKELEAQWVYNPRPVSLFGAMAVSKRRRWAIGLDWGPARILVATEKISMCRLVVDPGQNEVRYELLQSDVAAIYKARWGLLPAVKICHDNSQAPPFLFFCPFPLFKIRRLRASFIEHGYNCRFE